MLEAPLDAKLKYPWQQAVLDALFEYHADRIRDTITSAERAISGRLLQSPTDPEELLALRDALFVLQVVFPKIKPQVESLIELTKNLEEKLKQNEQLNWCLKYPWQQVVMDAFASPFDTLPAKINLAERTIAGRLTDSNEPDRDEQRALKEALGALRQLISETRISGAGEAEGEKGVA